MVSDMAPGEFKAARQRLGLSIAKMATALHVTARTICHWEAGERAIPGPAEAAIGLLARLAEVEKARAARADRDGYDAADSGAAASVTVQRGPGAVVQEARDAELGRLGLRR